METRVLIPGHAIKIKLNFADHQQTNNRENHRPPPPPLPSPSLIFLALAQEQAIELEIPANHSLSDGYDDRYHASNHPATSARKCQLSSKSKRQGRERYANAGATLATQGAAAALHIMLAPLRAQ